MKTTRDFDSKIGDKRMRKTLLIVCTLLFGIAYGKGIVTMETADCSKFADKALQKECRKVQRKEAEKACYKLEYTFEQNKCLAKLNQRAAKETQSADEVPEVPPLKGEYPIVGFKAPQTCRQYNRNTRDKGTITIHRAVQSFEGGNIYLTLEVSKSSNIIDLPEAWMRTVAKTFGVEMSKGANLVMQNDRWTNSDMRVKKGKIYFLHFAITESEPGAIVKGFVCKVSEN